MSGRCTTPHGQGNQAATSRLDTFSEPAGSGMLEPVLRRLPPATPLLAGVGLFVLVAVLAATGESAVQIGQGWVPGLSQRNLDPAEAAEPMRRDDFETPPILRAAAAVGLTVLLLVIFLLVLIGLVAIVLGAHFERRGRRQKLQPLVPVDAAEDGDGLNVDVMRRAASGALDSLLAKLGGDPGDAVIVAWLMLEQAAAESGLARQPHQTPTEFTAAVLAELQVDGDALHQLRLLYQRARFSGHQVTGADVQQASVALRRLIADLGTPAQAGSPA